MGLKAADVKNVYGCKTIARCPKCEKTHTMLLDWQGRGIPRKFCQPCKNECDNYEHIDDSGNAPWHAIRSTVGLS